MVDLMSLLRDVLVCSLQVWMLNDFGKNMFPYRVEPLWKRIGVYFAAALCIFIANHMGTTLFNIAIIPASYTIAAIIIFQGSKWKKVIMACCYYLIMGNGTQAYAIAAEQPQRDNPLKHVEDTIEQNDNNFDGLINNTPQTPTVADFEQRAKAGEAISVTDLAKAVKAEKREQPQKKPSILKKLDEYKKQAAQQPKDKQKEHKKDLEV
jgi:apolipoprotein N-acyltransferase